MLQMRRELDAPRQIHSRLEHEAIALIDGRRSIFAAQIGGIDRRIAEGHLIVIGVVEALRQRVGRVELVAAGETFVDGEPERVVVRVGAGLEARDRLRPAGVRIEDRAHRYANEEVRAEIVNAIGANDPVLSELVLHTEVELLHHRVLDVVIDDVHAFLRAACSRNDESAEGIGNRRSSRHEVAGRVEIVDACRRRR